MEYAVLNFICFITSLYEIYFKKKAWMMFIIIVVIIFTGSRLNVGYDYLGYKTIHENVISMKYSELIDFKFAEIGYLLLNKMFSNYNYLLLFIAIFNIFFKYIALKNISYYPFFSLYIYMSIYFLDWDFGKIRIAMATTFFLIAIRYLKSSKIKFIFIILVGSTFHISLLAVIPIIFIRNTIKTAKIYIVIIFLSLFIRSISYDILLFLNKKLPDYINMKINYYIDAKEVVGFYGINFSLIILLMFFTYFLYNKKYIDLGIRHLFNIYFLSIPLYIILSLIPQLTRISSYYKIVLIIIFANILKNKKNKYERFVVAAVFFMYSILNIIKIVYSQPDVFLPYRSFIVSFSS